MKRKLPHPYRDLPSICYWNSASEKWQAGDFTGLYQSKWPITKKTCIATAGSCFSQHISRHLRQRAFAFCDVEPPPEGLPLEQHALFGYGIYSARYGNIYNSKQWLQLVEAACGKRTINEVWETEGRYYDPLRPTIEPDGFGSKEEVLALRQSHHKAVREMISRADVFVFTLGLTEIWVNRETGLVYPTCPGTVAGRYEESLHQFIDLGMDEIVADMEQAMSLWHTINPHTKFLLTVSPVPMAATVTKGHVVAVSTYSKSLLRVAAGMLSRCHDYVDYFPSYELAVSHLNPEKSYADDSRTIRPEVVSKIMDYFFSAHGITPSQTSFQPVLKSKPMSDSKLHKEIELICEEAELDESKAS